MSPSGLIRAEGLVSAGPFVCPGSRYPARRMREALEALSDTSRPLAARLAEAIELERECQEALRRAAECRASLEAQRQAQLDARKGARAGAADRFAGDELTGSDVRDVILRFPGGFTISELADELDADVRDVKKFLEPLLLSGVVRDTGERFSRKAIFEYVPVTPAPTPARERRAPPEVSTAPAGELRMATGEPVRVRAVDRLTRQQRSGSANVHHHKMRDKRYDEMMAKRAQAAEAAREKANRDMEKLKKLRKKK